MSLLVNRDVGADPVDRHQEVVWVHNAGLEQWDDVWKLGYSNNSGRRCPDEMFIQQHPVGSGNDAAPASADGGAYIENGALDTRDEGAVGALFLKLFAYFVPFDVELGGGVLSVVRVFEVDRSERPWSIHELSEAF